MYVGKRSANNETRCLDSHYSSSFFPSVGKDFPWRYPVSVPFLVKVKASRQVLVNRKREGRRMKGLFWEFLFFFFSSSQRERAAVLDQFFLEQGVSCFVILVRFWKDNYPPNLIIYILRALTKELAPSWVETEERDGRDEKEGMERQRGVIAAASGMSALSTMLPRKWICRTRLSWLCTFRR